MNQLVEKYRPKSFSDLVGNQEIVEELKEMIKAKNIPHILFSGPPGNGKTSFTNVLIKEIYGGDTKQKYKEINASDDNGIETVRGQVKTFASHSSSQGDVPFRILVLEEGDEITSKAQPALRRIMELYSKHCRFIITCNYLWKIISPIRSRCKCYELKPITPAEMIPRIRYICDQEHINITDDAIQYIADKSNGDMRVALNNYLESALLAKKQVTVEFLQQNRNQDANTLQLLRDALNGKFIQSRERVLLYMKQGFTSRRIIGEMVESCYPIDKFPELMKGEIALALAESEIAIVNGVNEMAAMSAFIARLGLIGQKWRGMKDGQA
jgi:replication factor C small subunit